MKFLRILFLINTLVVLIFLLLVFTSEKQSQLSAEITTEIPKPAAFKLILKQFGALNDGQNEGTAPIVKFTFFEENQPINTHYRLIIDEEQFKIKMLPLNQQAKIFALKNLQQEIVLKELLDGSTGLHWQISYQVKGWTTRLLNRFFWKPALQRFLNKEVEKLTSVFAN